MADDDLDMLQQLLEMAEDDGASDASDGRNAPFASGPTDQENLPANKRPRLGEAAKPLTAGRSSNAAE